MCLKIFAFHCLTKTQSDFGTKLIEFYKKLMWLLIIADTPFLVTTVDTLLKIFGYFIPFGI